MVFDIDHSTGADRYDFQQICPAFIQQVTSEACKADQSHQSTSAPMETEKHMGKSKLLSIHFSTVNMYWGNFQSKVVVRFVNTMEKNSTLLKLPLLVGCL